MGKSIDGGRSRPDLSATHARCAEDDQQAAGRLISRAVALAKAGDREALGYLYARYAENVCGYVRSIVGDQDEAEDITQHVFAKLVRVIDKYEEREVPFLAWVLRVARNAAIDHIRAQRPIPVEEVIVADGVHGPRPGEGKVGELTDALGALPEEQREVLVLRHLAGYSPSEIAAHMQRSESSIHGLHHRGRKALQSELSRRGAAPSTSSRSAAPLLSLLPTDQAAQATSAQEAAG